MDKLIEQMERSEGYIYTYNGKHNPYSVGLTIGEIISNTTGQSREILIDVFAKLHELENYPELSNEPLTLDELKETVGEPVWIGTGYDMNKQITGSWVIIHSVTDEYAQFMNYVNGYRISDYGKTWLAYKHKPKE